MILKPGDRLGPYEVVDLIGAGGMGEVYRSRDTRLNRTVAIKVLSPSLGSDPEFRLRFEREARLASALDDPHICTVFDVGHEHGVAFLVMQHVAGETLAALLNRGALPLDVALESRHSNRVRAGHCSPCEHPPPRSQAVEHHGRRGVGEDPGLRSGEIHGRSSGRPV